MNHGISLIGSKGQRGRPAYTSKLDQNLFQQLEPDVRECFLKGDGGEIPKSQGSIGKMQAVHSSSALGVNIFQYWKKIDQIPAIAAACGLCQKGNMSPEKIVFEDKYAIDKTKFRHPPNIDVVIYNSDAARFNCFAIESKFTEAYSPQGHQGIKKAYTNLGRIWEDLPALYQMAISVCPDDHRFSPRDASCEFCQDLLEFKQTGAESVTG